MENVLWPQRILTVPPVKNDNELTMMITMEIIAMTTTILVRTHKKQEGRDGPKALTRGGAGFDRWGLDLVEVN